MTLKVSIVPDLEDIVVSIETFLQSHCVGADPFAEHTVIVPSLGVRSWLTPQLAQRLGATSGMNDGVLANVHVRYIGHLQTLIRDAAEIKSDAWNRDAVNLAVLRALADFPETARLEKKYNGRLNAARTLADRFDRYAARRPELIRSWDNGVPALGELDTSKFEWQFHLWCKVREIIGESPWPVLKEEICARLRAGESLPGLPDRLMIAGFENISPTQLDLIDALGTVVDIELIFVQQSPFLAHEWNKLTTELVPNRYELPVSDAFAPASVTPLRLPPAWMKGSFELELLLSAYGLPVSYSEVPAEHSPTSQLLQHVQRTVASGQVAHFSSSDSHDASIQIHRAHNLSRQVEVLHDALLHAFEEIEDLQPHDVVILCANPEAAAPVLEAVFEKTVKNASGHDVRIPLVVADRSLREVSEGAELSAHVLHLVGSRFDSESFLAVATHPLVARRFQVSASDVATWMRHLDQSRLRWGLDAEHRQVHGLVAPDLTAHSWLESVERSLLGAVMPVAEEPVVLGEGVRPLPFVDSSETQSLLTLVEVLSVLVRLEHTSRSERTMDSWCTLFAQTLNELCGTSCTDLDDVFLLLNQYQRAAHQINEKTSQSSNSDVVPFSQFAEYLNGDLQTTSGRQPLRTGAVTATSFIPLRTVPFKVVCVLGYDDGTLPSGESEGDDLIAATPMLGDGDARLESRRILLDAMMAARERFIVTCTGRSIKNNNLLPLVTPLAELLDFFADCGLAKPLHGGDVSAVEYIHPRHLGSAENFTAAEMDKGVTVPVQPWSFDAIARTIAETRQKNTAKKSTNHVSIDLPEPLETMTLDDLVRLVYKPLDYYLRKGLGIWRPWVDEVESATLPISGESRKLAWACRDIFHSQADIEQMESALRSKDILPVAPFDHDAVTSAIELVGAYRKAYDKTLNSAPSTVEISLEMTGLPTLTETINGFHVEEKILTFVSFQKLSDKDLYTMILRLLVLIADGIDVEKAMMYHLNTNGKGTTVRSIVANLSLTKDVAQQRLEGILSVEPIARAIACPLFDKTTESWMNLLTDDDSTPEQKFESFVENDFTFKKSDELIVFGSSPEFDEVYEDPQGLMRTFFTSYFDAIQVGGKTGKWELSA
jgi:exodeoxyribonuclease V gamma subunit